MGRFASTSAQSRGKTMPSKEELTEAFEKADKEKTGKITLKQFQEVLIATEEYESDKKMYKNKGMVDALLFALDDNEDGELTLQELLKLADSGMDDEMGVKMFKRLVENADKDKDGFLTAKELKVMMLMMEPGEDDEEIEDMVDFMRRMCSHDGSKKVKADVVVQFFINPDEIEKSNDAKEKAKVMFRMFDTNLDGYIDKKELAGYMNQLSDDKEEDKEGDAAIGMLMKMMIAKFDEDEDGKLNYEEFEEFLEEN